MSDITAKASFNNQQLAEIPVLNPGDYFGRCWLVELGGSYFPLFLIVEADNPYCAIEELADNPQYGPQIIVAEADLGDYPEHERHYGPNGQVLDLDHVMIHGDESHTCPFPCRYVGEGLPAEGVSPLEFEHADQE